MFPKLTSNLLQINLQRAAATKSQNRTVFQFSPSYPPSPLPPTPFQPNSLLASFNGASSSSSGGSGAGPEGTRSNAGSRFYEGYTGPGRAVTQANVIASHDNAAVQREEVIEVELKPKRAKDATYYVNIRRPHPDPDIRYLRRNSLASGFIGPTRLDRFKTFPTLSAVQTRSRHAFATPGRSSPLASQVYTADVDGDGLQVRLSRNASRRKAAQLATLRNTTTDDIPPSLLRSSDALAMGSASKRRQPLSKGKEMLPRLSVPQFVDTLDPEVEAWRVRVEEYTKSGNWRALTEEVKALLGEAHDPAFYTTENYSIIFGAFVQPTTLLRLNDPGVIPILELYNQMVAKKVAPTPAVFNSLVTLLSLRDVINSSRLSKLEREAEACRLLNNEAGLAASLNEAESLRNATYYKSALMLFHSGFSGMRFYLSTAAIESLLRCAVAHKDLDNAIRLFAHLDRRSQIPDRNGKPRPQPSPYAFKHLIQAYGQAKDVQGALQAFEAYRKVDSQKRHSGPWHAMLKAYFVAGQPEDAVALLEEMLSVTDTEARAESLIPAPNALTYTVVVEGFVESGMVTEAMVWLERLIQAEVPRDDKATPAQSGELEMLRAAEAEESDLSVVPALTPIPPKTEAWLALLSGLYKNNNLPAFTKYYFECDARSDVKGQPFGTAWPQPFLSYFIQLTGQSMETLEPTDPKIDTMLESLLVALQSKHVRRSSSPMLAQWPMMEAAKLAAGQGRLGICLRMAETLRDISEDVVTSSQSIAANSGEFLVGADLTQQMQDAVAVASVLGRTEAELQLARLLEVAELVKGRGMGLFPTGSVLEPYVAAFYRELPTSTTEGMTSQRWEILAAAFTQHFQSGNMAAEEYGKFVENLKENAAVDGQLSPELTAIVDEAFRSSLITESEPRTPSRSPLTQTDSPASSEAMFSTASPTSSHSSAASYVTIDSSITWYLSNLNLNFTQASKPASNRAGRSSQSPPSAVESFRVCMSSIERGLYPDPLVIGKFLSYLVRGGLYEEAKQLYTASMPLVSSYMFNPQEREKAWYMIENGMMTAAAFAGDVDAANAHRYAMVQRGFAPSAAAYGQLIVASKTLTDEASIASELFTESQAMGVPATPFLYNVVISALSRARRAEDALQLFKKMKQHRVIPSSVTYGALIGACARVGDETMATTLFEEMRRQPNYLPRVPPFNAMMQMYVTAKPDRERALEIHRMMQQCRLQPTEHTYKVSLLPRFKSLSY
ncbi:hypothetical protein FRB93_013424 [Tulasnella sp. JGI-2019a]|nr:hypothetical protein FRB93_013424 [Tulasnella sp. JGI-2019a]